MHCVCWKILLAIPSPCERIFEQICRTEKLIISANADIIFMLMPSHFIREIHWRWAHITQLHVKWLIGIWPIRASNPFLRRKNVCSKLKTRLYASKNIISTLELMQKSRKLWAINKTCYSSKQYLEWTNLGMGDVSQPLLLECQN